MAFPWQILADLVTGGGLGALAGLLPRNIRQPLIDVGLPFAGAMDQQRAEDKAQAETEGRYTAGLEDIERLRDAYVPGVQALGADLLDESQGVDRSVLDTLGQQYGHIIPLLRQGAQQDVAGLGALQGNVVGGLQDRMNRNMARLEGLGAQAEADINRTFDQRASQQQDYLSERGLGASTLLAPTLANVDRERSGALGDLNEQLRREAIGLDTSLSGDVLNAQDQYGRLGIDLGRSNRGAEADFYNQFFGNQANVLGQQGANRLGLLHDIGMAPMQMDIDLTTQRGNWLANRQDVPPSQSAFASLMNRQGMGTAPTPEAPSPWESAGAGALGTAGGVASGLAIKAMFVLCIDGDAKLNQPNGTTVTLCDVAIGDYVQGIDGEFYEVTAKDYGAPHKEQEGDFIEWVAEDGTSLIVTRNHPVIAASPIKDVRPALPVPCGDIMLKGCGGYIANGFDVASMIQLNWATLSDEQKRSLTCRS